MRKKAAQLLVAFALIVSIGGHWAMLQSVAWLGMVASYSRDGSLLVALEKTFDGQNPCKICRVVQAGKQSEKQEPLLKADTKLELWLSSSSEWAGCPTPHAPAQYGAPFSMPRFESPPTPPPRRV